MVTVADGSLLDREIQAMHTITVRATSQDGSTADTVFAIQIQDVDEFDTSGITDSNAALDRLNENAINGTAVGITASAFDADATNNVVSYSLDDNANGRFAIDSLTGIVTVADGSLLNYEAATFHGIVVRALSQDGSFTTLGFTIQLSDVDEFDVTVPIDANVAVNEVKRIQPMALRLQLRPWHLTVMVRRIRSFTRSTIQPVDVLRSMVFLGL